MEKQLKRGTHMVSIFEADQDFGFYFVENTPGVPGMITLRNRSGEGCVAASQWKPATESK